tara:strand:- start:485 stop:1675 length:1191 start_codon:yes stop_codon:yes gene_type:complete
MFMHKFVNQHRINNGRKELKFSDSLSIIAQAWVEHLYNTKQFKHNPVSTAENLGGLRDIDDWINFNIDEHIIYNGFGEDYITKKGYDYVVNKFGDTTYCLRLTLAEEVYEWLEMWKRSPPHNKNMLHDKHEYAGYGHYKGIGVQMFSVNEEITGTLRFKVDTTLEKILITLGYDYKLDGEVLAGLIDSVDLSSLKDRGINHEVSSLDLRGLRSRYFDCSNNNIKNIYLEKSNFDFFNCSNNELEILDFRSSKFEILKCNHNKIKQLKFDENIPNFRYIFCKEILCYNNRLDSINFSPFQKLRKINCSNNNLKKINLSENKYLEHLICNNNKILNINFKNNRRITKIDCSYNLISSINFNNCYRLKDINISNNLISKKNIRDVKKKFGREANFTYVF